MAKTKVDILNGVIWKQILIFFFPILLGTFFQQLYNTVDAIVVGNFVGKEALGAVGGSTGTLMNLLVGFIVGIASGATVVISQFYGRSDREGVSKGVTSGIFLAVVSGIFMSIVGIVFAPDLLKAMKVPTDILPYSITYMRIYFTGLVPALIYNMGASTLRATGDSKRPLYFLIVSCVVNIVLDLLFVAVFRWEVVGVGVATVISQIVSCVLVLDVLYRTEESYKFSLKDFGFDKEVLQRIIVIGLPTGVQSVLYSISNVLIQTSVNSYGVDTVAAMTAFGKIDAIFWMISGAFGTAIMTFAGQNFGAGNYDRVRKGMKVTILMYSVTTIAISLILYTGGSMFYRLFTSDTEVINIGMQLLRFLCPFWVSFVFVEIFSSGMRACGDSLVPMLMTALGICGIRVLWIFMYNSTSVLEVLYCYPITWIITSVLFIIYYLQGGWFRRSLRQKEKIIEAENA